LRVYERATFISFRCVERWWDSVSLVQFDTPPADRRLLPPGLGDWTACRATRFRSWTPPRLLQFTSVSASRTFPLPAASRLPYLSLFLGPGALFAERVLEHIFFSSSEDQGDSRSTNKVLLPPKWRDMGTLFCPYVNPKLVATD